jgi:hypothetical protein
VNALQAELAQAPGVTLHQTPVAVTLVFPAKFFLGGRILPRCGPVAHPGRLGRGEQLHLPHALLSRITA